MYTDDDLNLAIEKKIFTQVAVDAFRDSMSLAKNTPIVDEENFKVVGGFNDIFVVIACCLLLFSTSYVLKPFNESIALFCFAGLSWALSEFFILKRKMSMPAIILLIAFVGGCFFFSMSFFVQASELTLILATAVATVSAYCHWLRFNVPITVAAGTLALIGFVVAIAMSAFPNAKNLMLGLVSLCGLATFLLAMYWDASDIERVTQKSDVAFWLHLVSAPLVIHPMFSMLGIFDESQTILSMSLVIVLYLLMTVISIAIDRRAFMVSALAYVLYALSNIINNNGDVGYSLALTGVFIGAALLLLSAFWQAARQHIVKSLPLSLKKHLPVIAD
jgi:hypothetical protein